VDARGRAYVPSVFPRRHRDDLTASAQAPVLQRQRPRSRRRPRAGQAAVSDGGSLGCGGTGTATFGVCRKRKQIGRLVETPGSEQRRPRRSSAAAPSLPLGPGISPLRRSPAPRQSAPSRRSVRRACRNELRSALAAFRHAARVRRSEARPSHRPRPPRPPVGVSHLRLTRWRRHLSRGSLRAFPGARPRRQARSCTRTCASTEAPT
jgi:hypothetical protein